MSPDPATFVKRRPDAPDGFFVAEAAGLAWLAAAAEGGGVPAVEVLHVEARQITLRRLTSASGNPVLAEQFGRRLAATHASGADCHGAEAPGAGGRGWIGPLPLSVVPTGEVGAATSWGEFFASERLCPYLRLARDRAAVDAAGARVVERVVSRLTAGDADLTGPAEPVARLHGDLWSGNVVWTPDGAFLIDPAAHGGHRESDLAMLALFGAPYLERTLAAYHEVHPLASGWRERVGVHQLFPLLVHAALFGGGYGAVTVDVARRYA